MLSKFSLLLALFVTVSFVSAQSMLPGWQVHRRSPDPAVLDTNAKRFAAGLPPLPPIRRRAMANVIRAAPAPTQIPVLSGTTPMTGMIHVRDSSNKFLGFVAKNLQNGHFVLTQEQAGADKFSTSVHSSGQTAGVSLLDTFNPGSLHLAGIIPPGQSLSAGSGNVATLGDAPPTPAGSTPQGNSGSSLPGNSETAIWNFDKSDNSLKPQWVNPDSTTPPTSIMFDSTQQMLLLTGSSTLAKNSHPGAQDVSFFFM